MNQKPKEPVKCIKCGRVKSVEQIAFKIWRCGVCAIEFDDDPDEGGDYGHRPDQRALRTERNKQNRRGNRY